MFKEIYQRYIVDIFKDFLVRKKKKFTKGSAEISAMTITSQNHIQDWRVKNHESKISNRNEPTSKNEIPTNLWWTMTIQIWTDIDNQSWTNPDLVLLVNLTAALYPRFSGMNVWISTVTKPLHFCLKWFFLRILNFVEKFCNAKTAANVWKSVI